MICPLRLGRLSPRFFTKCGFPYSTEGTWKNKSATAQWDSTENYRGRLVKRVIGRIDICDPILTLLRNIYAFVLEYEAFRLISGEHICVEIIKIQLQRATCSGAHRPCPLRVSWFYPSLMEPEKDEVVGNTYNFTENFSTTCPPKKAMTVIKEGIARDSNR